MCVLVNALGEAVEAEMGWEVAHIVVLAVRVNMQLQHCNRILVVQVLNRPKKNTTLGTIRVMILHFTLKTELQEVGLGELKDILASCPLRGLDSNNWVKSRHRELKDLPQVSIPIVGLAPNCSQHCIDPKQQAAGDEPREKVHEWMAGVSVAASAKARDAQSLVTVLQHD